MIGTGGHGHTFPGATTPWGMVQATPWAHGSDAWDSQAGFHMGDGEVLRFFGMAHTALSGAGSGEMGELRLLPLGEQAQISYLIPDSVQGSPGYFSGLATSAMPSSAFGGAPAAERRAAWRRAERCAVAMEATATPRGAVHRFQFPESGCDNWPRKLVQLSLKEALMSFWGYKLGDYELRAVSPHLLKGCAASTISGIGGADSYMCFLIAFGEPFTLPDGHLQQYALPSEVMLEFPNSTSSLTVRVAVSRVDLPHARATMARELSKTFEEIRSEAEQLWESALGAVKVTMEPQSRLREFYTALYHMMLFPSLLSEHDGAYRLQRNASAGDHGLQMSLASVDEVLPIVYIQANQTLYSTFSLWDTYRTLHPLMNLVHPQVSTDFGHSLVRMAEVWGRLPPWQLVQSPTDMMEGDGGSIVLATMARDGLLDANSTFAVLSTIREEVKPRALKGDTISALLEEARADQCVAEVAKQVQEAAIADKFEKRALTVFQLHWDEHLKVFKPTNVPWDEYNVNEIRAQDFAEGTALQYSWAAEWDLTRLIDVHGGRDNFTCALAYFFTAAPEPEGVRADVTGNLHGFTQGNEPDFHAPYLFSHVGRPAWTQVVVDTLVKQMFSALPDGLPGNDDLGAMSGWLALSVLGFYPAQVCGKDVALGRPFVSSAELRVRGGTLNITVHNQTDENMYVDSLTWNGQELDAGRSLSGGPAFTLPWSELHKGGELVFSMTPEAPSDDLQCSGRFAKR